MVRALLSRYSIRFRSDDASGNHNAIYPQPSNQIIHFLLLLQQQNRDLIEQFISGHDPVCRRRLHPQRTAIEDQSPPQNTEGFEKSHCVFTEHRHC